MSSWDKDREWDDEEDIEVDEEVEEGPIPGKFKPRVQLVGQDGNAFAIIGRVRAALRRGGYTKEEIDRYSKEATSGDYSHVLATSMEWADVY